MVISSLLVVVVLFVVEPFYSVHFQRAIVFVQSRADLNVMPIMLSYCFRVLHPVARFVPVILQHIVVAIFSDVAPHGCLFDAVRGCLLIMPFS
jgi:hypothetical protein